MRYFFLTSLIILLFSCNNDEDVNDIACEDLTVTFDYTFYTSYLKNTTRYDYNNEWLRTEEYFFDEEGKVIASTHTSAHYPEYNSTNEYEYDSEGKIIASYVNNELNRTVIWNNNIAEVFNSENQKLTEQVFCNNRLTEVKSGYLQNSIRYKKYNYDSNDNIVSAENESEIFVEYLNYNTNKTNPYYLLKSIGVLYDWRNTLFSKNIFIVEKVYPYQGDDFNFPLTYYDYDYIFDNEGRVYELEDDKTAIYVFRFEYE